MGMVQGREVAGSFENRRCAVLLCFPLRCRLAAIPPFSQKKRTYRQGGRSSLERERGGREVERDRAMEHSGHV
jgi:hypothetical protein